MTSSSPRGFSHDSLDKIVERLDQQSADLRALSAKVSALESEIDELRRRSDVEIPEDVLMAISAAVSAYLGNRGKVKAVRFSRHRTWAHQGRQAAQSRRRIT